MKEDLFEEVFFFMYHMQIPKQFVLGMDYEERKWIINRFVEQKRRENEEIEKANSKAKAKGKK